MSNAAKIQYLALDVDESRFHGCLVPAAGPEVVEFYTLADTGELVKKVEKIRDPASELRICYEATYLGFSLQRQLSQRGYCCEVIAPSLIPKKPGECVKTDRRDCRKLAEYYRKGLLTVVHIPDEGDEKVRGLIRSRGFLSGQLKALKGHLIACGRRMCLDYKRQTGGVYWTQVHRDWLWKQIKALAEDALKVNLERLMLQVEHLETELRVYEDEIERLSRGEKYRDAVQALCCYRGIDTLSALTLVSELGDIRRFDHPRRLTSYAGFGIVEQSSGGRQRRYHTSGAGNRFIRTTLVEACQSVFYPPRISRALTRRREGADLRWIETADRGMVRLHRKAQRLWHAHKSKNKIKVACARELLGFVWESLRNVSCKN